MRWIYLSPHFDDVVLSCGGLVWQQAQDGQQVEVWTVCAGGPPPGAAFSPFAESLHARWQTGPEAVPARRAEDEVAVARLGAAARYWSLPDCIYRRLPDGGWLVNGEEDLWKPVHPGEAAVVERLRGWLAQALQPGDQLVSPLTLGNHVDHFLVRAAAEALDRKLLYYADYPYAVRADANIEAKTGADWERRCMPVPAAALEPWQAAVAAYASQISTFWGGLAQMREAIAQYWQAGGGTCLFAPPHA